MASPERPQMDWSRSSSSLNGEVFKGACGTKRSRSQTGTKQDRITLRFIWIVILLSIAGGVAAELPYGRELSLGMENKPLMNASLR